MLSLELRRLDIYLKTMGKTVDDQRLSSIPTIIFAKAMVENNSTYLLSEEKEVLEITQFNGDKCEFHRKGICREYTLAERDCRWLDSAVA